jgi:uncharacterized membrane protein YphA (DoxX/SURF4 family)
MNALRWLNILCGIGVGALFVYAGWGKIPDPYHFSKLIKAYKLLPNFMLNPVAIVSPWLEVIAGSMMITGILRRPASLIIGCLMLGFLVMLGWAMHHGYEINCGCFPGSTAHLVGWADIGRDLLLFAGCVVCLVAPDGRRTNS